MFSAGIICTLIGAVVMLVGNSTEDSFFSANLSWYESFTLGFLFFLMGKMFHISDKLNEMKKK